MITVVIPHSGLTDGWLNRLLSAWSDAPVGPVVLIGPETPVSEAPIPVEQVVTDKPFSGEVWRGVLSSLDSNVMICIQDEVMMSAASLIRLAKARGFALLLVGHVTKDGQIAGPKVLEHMVGTVLAFEGERGHQFRILRATKNRSVPTDESGVVEVSDSGTDGAAPAEAGRAARSGP